MPDKLQLPQPQVAKVGERSSGPAEHVSPSYSPVSPPPGPEQGSLGPLVEHPHPPDSHVRDVQYLMLGPKPSEDVSVPHLLMPPPPGTASGTCPSLETMPHEVSHRDPEDIPSTQMPTADSSNPEFDPDEPYYDSDADEAWEEEKEEVTV